MKAINLDTIREGIIVFSERKQLVECIFLCKHEEFGGIRTTEECQNWCPEFIGCKRLHECMKRVERASYKESDV